MFSRDKTATLPSRTDIAKGTKEQESKSALDFEKPSGNPQRAPLNCSIARRIQPEVYQPNAIVRKCDVRRAQTRTNEAR